MIFQIFIKLKTSILSSVDKLHQVDDSENNTSGEQKSYGKKRNFFSIFKFDY